MDRFVADELSDFYLPFNELTLPGFVGEDGNHGYRDLFLETQRYFLSRFKDIELEGGTHMTLPRGGDSYFYTLSHLGKGGHG